MIRTYADVLREREENMTNYDMDELRRQEKKKVEQKLSGDWPKSVEIGKEEKFKTFEIDISDDIFLRVAKEAHERDITFNSMVLSIIKDGLKNVEYRFEHDSKPQLLNEDN